MGVKHSKSKRRLENIAGVKRPSEIVLGVKEYMGTIAGVKRPSKMAEGVKIT